MTDGIGEVLAREDPTQFAIALSDLVFARFEQVGFAGLTPAERVAHCVDWLEREVNNGGFFQFFWNSSGDLVPETLAALRTIGAEHTARLLERACAVIPGGPARERERRQDQVDALPEAERDTLLALDDAFYQYEDDLTALMRAYVEAHRGEFHQARP